MNKLLRNPFYALAMVLGLLFTITTCADAVLMMKTNRAGAMPRRGEPGYELMALLDRHGTEILVGELAALGLCTVAAIRLDHVRDRREFARRQGREGPVATGQGPGATGQKAGATDHEQRSTGT